MLTIDKILPFLNNEFIEDASKNKKTETCQEFCVSNL